MATKPLCSIPNCGNRAYARTWCLKHYTRWQRWGDPDHRSRPANGEAYAYLSKIVIAYQDNECLIWPFHRSRSGYAMINIHGSPTTVSRIVCQRVYGPSPAGQIDAAHSCGNGHLGCVNPKHLRWATRSENADDKLIHGTITQGERHPRSKLTAADVREIRRLCQSASARSVAREYRVSSSTIERILRGESWAALP